MAADCIIGHVFKIYKNGLKIQSYLCKTGVY